MDSIDNSTWVNGTETCLPSDNLGGVSNLAGLGVTGASGLFLSYLSFKYVRINFDLRRTVFSLVMIDAAVSFLGNLGLIVAVISILWTDTLCPLMFFVLYLPNSTGLALTAEVAVIR